MATNSKGNNVTKSVAMPPDLALAVEQRIEKLRMNNFSAYVRKLVEKDLIERGAILYDEASLPPAARIRPPVKHKITRKP